MTADVLLRPADVGGALAFQALLLDGSLVRLWGATARPATTPESPALRAAALRPLVPHGLVVAGRAALWLHHGGAAPPALPTGSLTLYYRSHAHRPHNRPDLTVRQATLLARDVDAVDGLAVTSLARTAADLARDLPDDEALACLRTLVTCGLRASDVRDLLQARLRWPRREHVLRLAAAADAGGTGHAEASGAGPDQAGSCGTVVARDPVMR